MSAALAILEPRPIYTPVTGAPFRPGNWVLVVRAVDVDVHDVRRWIGCAGEVRYLEYSCGSGQSYPGDPMISVRFDDGTVEEFWREELARLTGGDS